MAFQFNEYYARRDIVRIGETVQTHDILGHRVKLIEVTPESGDGYARQFVRIEKGRRIFDGTVTYESAARRAFVSAIERIAGAHFCIED